MIKRFQFQFVGVVVGTLLIVFSVVLLVLNLSVRQTSVKRAEDFMTAVVENDGFSFSPSDIPDMQSIGNPELMRAGRYFYVKVGREGDIIDLNLEMMFDFTPEDAESVVAAVAASNRQKGNAGNFRFISAEKPYGRILVFAERSIEIGMLNQLISMSIWVAIVVTMVFILLAAFLARWAAGPIATSISQQHRFVSDASHELKTPLTIISANVDVLQNEIGENQRLSHIRTQIERMSGLIQGLLMLAKTNEGPASALIGEFSLSNAIQNTALEFESRAFEEGKQYTYNVAKNITYNGDEVQIRQLVGILIDNAIRYSDKNGQVDVSLSMGSNRKHLSVYNTGVGVSVAERDRIFERFYRVDESRTRETGGYGVGLSIAKAIVEAHKGKITVASEFGKWIRFDVTL